MTPWQGTRTITVVSACMTVAGMPTFAVNQVQVTHEEYANGEHYGLAEVELMDAGNEEPYVHFDEFEAPAFLVPAVTNHVGAPAPENCLAAHQEELDAAHR
jgi:hypothetical protein